MKNRNLEKILFLVTVVLIVAIILSGSYLPMVDLPQHAAQVATLDAILKNQSSWSDIVELNFETPYLIGYLTWLSLYQIFDIVTSSKLLISIIFILYIFSFFQLIKIFNATNLVYWIALPSFFGFCFQWGFVTFLFAISVGLLFFIENIKWTKKVTIVNSLRIGLFGLVLFFSHVLSFAFFCFLSFLYIVSCVKSFRDILRYLPVYAFFAGLLGFYFLQHDPLTGLYSYGENVMWHGIKEKLINLLVYPWSMVVVDYRYLMISIFLLIAPFSLGFRLSKEIKKYIPVLGFLFLWLVLPHFLNNTYFIYERFALLFFGFYYLIFEKRECKNYLEKLSPIFYTSFFISIVYLVAQIVMAINLAKKDSQDFVEVLKYVPAHKRVLTLAFAHTSPSVGIPFTYVHFGSWYQAEKQGWSDFNFAWFHPQIVRFKPATVPEVKPGFEWTPLVVQNLKSCTQYDLLFVRAYSPMADGVIKNSLCKNYSLLVNQGTWFIYTKV